MKNFSILLFCAVVVVFSACNINSELYCDKKNRDLQRASRGGNLGEIEILIREKGATANTECNSHNHTPALIEAVKYGMEASVRKLLEFPQAVDPNWRDKAQQTALMYAAERNQEGIVMALLDKGANPNLRNNRGGWTAFMEAVQKGNTAIVASMIAKKANVNDQTTAAKTILMLAAEEGHEALIPLLLRAGANPNDQDLEGKTAFMWAVNRKEEKVVVEMLKNEADIALTLRDNNGWTALMYAAFKGYSPIVSKLLADRRIDPNDQGEYNNYPTALMIAAEAGHTHVVKILLRNTANANLKDQDGKTAWKRAFDQGQTAVLDILPQDQAEAPLRARKGRGITPSASRDRIQARPAPPSTAAAVLAPAIQAPPSQQGRAGSSKIVNITHHGDGDMNLQGANFNF